MPHIIVEHSADFSAESIVGLQKDIQKLMSKIEGAKFDPDQCKGRAFAFGDYLVGTPNQEKAVFLHITIKILAGRSLKIRQELSNKVIDCAKEFFDKLLFSPTVEDQLIETGSRVVDTISGVPHVNDLLQNSHLKGKRCDLSVDIVQMEGETYQKMRIED